MQYLCAGPTAPRCSDAGDNDNGEEGNSTEAVESGGEQPSANRQQKPSNCWNSDSDQKR